MVGALVAVACPAAQAASPVPARSCQLGPIPIPKRSSAPPLRFGLTALPQAGQTGAEPAPAEPRSVSRELRALRSLRGPGRPLVVRLNRFFWADGEAGLRRYERLARFYAARGFEVELQMRYHPSPAQEGDIRAWTRHVREVVRRFGAIRGVTDLQVANEVNLPFAPDSSDGPYRGARAALVEGVIAAADEARRRKLRDLQIGFNWYHRNGDAFEFGFWDELAARGGRRFARAVDWVAVDTYPGTFDSAPGSAGGADGGRAGIARAVAELRRCFMPVAGLGTKVPIHVGENGFPTPPGRSYAQQSDALNAMVRAVHALRGRYGVTDYRWFNLRDARTGATALGQNYGLMEDDYAAKPAFGLFRGLVRTLGR